MPTTLPRIDLPSEPPVSERDRQVQETLVQLRAAVLQAVTK